VTMFPQTQPVKYLIKNVTYFHLKTERYLCVHGAFISVKFNKKLCSSIFLSLICNLPKVT